MDAIIDSAIAILLIGCVIFVVKYAGAMIEVLSKKFRGKKYPLKKDVISPSDLKRNDIVTLVNYGECCYDGYYDGAYLFYPVNAKPVNAKPDDEYIRLNKSQIREMTTKVMGKGFLKWEKRR